MKILLIPGMVVLLTFSASAQKKTEKGWYEKALAKMESENFAGAIADLDKALEADPTHADAYFQRGFIRALQLDHEGALSDFDKAIELNPLQVQYFSERGVAKLNLGDREGGCADLKKAASMGDEAAKEMAYEYCP